MNLSPKIRTSEIIVQELKDEVLIYDLKANKAFCLNETSKLVWELCNGKNTVAEIKAKVSKQLKEIVSKDVIYLAIEQFNKNNLLEGDTSVEFDKHFGGLSRREVIRKVGLASVIALPIISAVTAPQAIMAASCLAPGTLTPFVAPNPTAQPSDQDCFNYCGTQRPDPNCCIGTSSAGGSFNTGNNQCDCIVNACDF